MDRPPSSRLARVAVIVLVLAALIWLVSFVGINLSGKQTSDRAPPRVATGENIS